MEPSVQYLAYEELNNQHWNEYFNAQASSREVY